MTSEQTRVQTSISTLLHKLLIEIGEQYGHPNVATTLVSMAMVGVAQTMTGPLPTIPNRERLIRLRASSAAHIARVTGPAPMPSGDSDDAQPTPAGRNV